MSPRMTFPVNSEDTKKWLRHQFYNDTKSVPNAQALSDAIGVLSAQAEFEGDEHEVFVRTAELDGRIYIDLANDEWEAVEIDVHGWRVVSDSPVRFRRPPDLKELPRPVHGGNVEELRDFINVGSEDDWKLIAAWLVQAMYPKGPYPILILQGEQGSAKSTTAKIIKMTGDPAGTAVRSSPRTEQDLMIAAKNAQILSFDNLSGMTAQMSDALCRLSTGGGFATRTLYENDRETVFKAKRPVILNGITNISNRADLLDRAIIIELPRIEPSERRTESELWEAFEEAYPRILGALMDIVGGVLRDRPNTKVQDAPRMADFAKLATAAERALGWNSGAFMESFNRARKDIDEYALEADPVAMAVVALLSKREEWTGTASKLLEELNDLVEEDTRRFKTWPKLPHNLTGALKRSAPVLRAEGIEYEDLPRSASLREKRLYRITPQDGRHEPHPSPTESPDDARSSEPERATGEASLPSREMVEDPACDVHDAHDDELETSHENHFVATRGDLQRLVLEIDGEDAGTFAVDLETTGLNPRRDRTRLISISTEYGTWVVDCFAVDPTPLFDALSDKTLVFHNAAFDLGFLQQEGFEVGEGGSIRDTMLMSRIAEGDENTKGKEPA